VEFEASHFENIVTTQVKLDSIAQKLGGEVDGLQLKLAGR
jgi:hypothetical protein